jgi:hypothetical protein
MQLAAKIPTGTTQAQGLRVLPFFYPLDFDYVIIVITYRYVLLRVPDRLIHQRRRNDVWLR